MSLLWDYFLNGGDKIDSGEYVLSKPPKKPGGFCNLKNQKGYWKIFLSIGTTFAFPECAADSFGGPEYSMNDNRFWYSFSLILKLVLMLGIMLQIFQLAVKLWAGIELVCEFSQVVEAFMDRFEVDRTNSSTVIRSCPNVCA